MKAMILAAGVGSRLDPLTRTIPKPMVPVVNRPVIEHIVEKLAAHNFNTIKINLHYLGNTIREYLGDGSQLGVEIEYIQEDQLWGDAGSVKRSERFFEDETFLVVGGDDISNINLSEFLEFHRKSGAAASQALSIVGDPSEYGIVLTEPDGRITKFQEKPAAGTAFSNTANTGVYLFEPHVLKTIPKDIAWGFGRNVFPGLLEAGESVYGFITEDYWKDVGNIQIYKSTNFDAMDGKVKLNILGTPRSEKVWVGEGSVIAPDVEIEERVVIGRNVTIGSGAKLLSDTVIGDGSKIGDNAVLQRTIVWNNATIGASTHLEGCIVGANASVSSNFGVFNGLIVDPIRKKS